MIAYWKMFPHLPERSDENRTRNCKAGGGDQCPCEVLDLHDLGWQLKNVLRRSNDRITSVQQRSMWCGVKNNVECQCTPRSTSFFLVSFCVSLTPSIQHKSRSILAPSTQRHRTRWNRDTGTYDDVTEHVLPHVRRWLTSSCIDGSKVRFLCTAIFWEWSQISIKGTWIFS
jgi:hypothetical protein